MLHGQTPDSGTASNSSPTSGSFASLVPKRTYVPPSRSDDSRAEERGDDANEDANSQQWAANIRLLVTCFGVSGLFTLSMFFFPVLRNLPIFGHSAAETWLWTFNPSLAYVGQGIIMGVETTLHMTLGAVVGWGLLSPLAHRQGWAPGPIDDWDSGSKGWLVWVSLSIMLADAIINLAHIAFRPIMGLPFAKAAFEHVHSLIPRVGRYSSYSLVPSHDNEPEAQPSSGPTRDPERDVLLPPSDRLSVDGQDGVAEKPEDAPEDQLVGSRVISIGLTASVLLCIATIRVVFGDLIPLYATVLAVAVALVLSVMGVRALGETDLNPVSGISKLAQLFFAIIIPASHKSGVLINLVSGAVVRHDEKLSKPPFSSFAANRAKGRSRRSSERSMENRMALCTNSMYSHLGCSASRRAYAGFENWALARGRPQGAVLGPGHRRHRRRRRECLHIPALH